VKGEFMGIRIHKKIGYGLVDVKTKKYNIVDTRFNMKDGYFSKDVYDQEEYNFDEFRKHIDNILKKDNSISMLLGQLPKKNLNFYDVITHNAEYGLSKVVLFQPFYKDWSRYDNIIDYMEVTESIPTVKPLNRCIYPFESYINLNTGLPYIEINNNKLYCHDILRDAKFYGSSFIKEIGFSNIKELKNNIVPIVPEIIKEYCKWLKVFNDDSTILTLKPLVYTYWS
jgi:hypothetical protein